MPVSLRWIERHSYSWDWDLAIDALAKADADAGRYRVMILDSLFEARESELGVVPSEGAKQEIAQIVDRRLEERRVIAMSRQRPPKSGEQLKADRKAQERAAERKQALKVAAEQGRRLREKSQPRRFVENTLWPRKS